MRLSGSHSSRRPRKKKGVDQGGVKGQVVLDQIRTIDKTRMVKKLGRLSQVTQSKVLDSLAEMFAP